MLISPYRPDKIATMALLHSSKNHSSGKMGNSISGKNAGEISIASS